ncbi:MULTISPECIES: metallophosphoesterase [unclassified Variovorax]|uniref:metallophosphoesterase n=1 Tax=unclassified Variovorax TaxID=663243 RepID=UPI0013176B2B|nr:MULTISPECIES: metallophosphoesterase [unclassified Variovorax]VTU42630.1 Calcineurin-like phosphoesterase superfamily domain protein [Variovorax sp. PBL-H6]VTU43793.1 Calcineurin-like phosphoesterase superfamily domain protein [Variovorax sp. SRS16]VTU43858.1 Calcineurin-like phosphoesterase superfamily domain protein [Variovorax sp. PBL-E5]
MKLHVLSDLHLEFYASGPLPVLADALVLAGDIVLTRDLGPLRELVSNYAAAGRPVLFVPGNHEFYSAVMSDALRQLSRELPKAGVTLLHNRLVQFGGVRFFGATLWTNYLLGTNGGSAAYSMHAARSMLVDHRAIALRRKGELRHFDPSDAAAAHRKSLRLLRTKLSTPFAGRTVVITHHGVHPGSIAPRYAGDSITPAFISDLRPLIELLQPALWVHGHVHDSFSYEHGQTRFVVNPRGYPRSKYPPKGEPMRFENSSFNPALVVEV